MKKLMILCLMLLLFAPCMATHVNLKANAHSHVGRPRMPSAIKVAADYEYGSITVTVTGYSGPVLVSLYDETGNLVVTKSAVLSGSGQIIMNDLDLTEGQYVLHVALGNTVYFGTFDA